MSKIFRSASWYLLEKMVRLAGAFLIGAWVARYLGPEKYGTFAYATALIATLGFLASWGVESLVIRDLVQDPSRAAKIVSTYFFVRLSGAILVPVIAAGFLMWTHPGESDLLALSLVLGVALAMTSMDAADCWLQSQQHSSTTSSIRLWGFGVGAVAKIAMVVAGASLIWFGFSALLESAAIALGYWLVMRRHAVNVSYRDWDAQEFKRLVVDGKTMALSGLTVVIYSKLDVLAIGSLISKEALGPYAIAASMCAAWNMVGMSVAQAWAPHISAALLEGESLYVGTLRRFLLAMFLVSTIGSLAIMWLAPTIFDLLLGEAYVAGGQVLAILVWSSVPVFMGVATSQIIVNEKIYWVSLVRTALGMVISVLLVAPMALNFGVTGVASLVIGSGWCATLAIFFSASARSTLSKVFSGNKVNYT
jgi:PST family polysaccharide transporter